MAYFGSVGLICFDRQGRRLWQLRLPLAKSFGGNATSPAIIRDMVILYRGNYVDHFLLAVDKQSGKERWRMKQTEPITGEMACTACPIIAGDKLIVHSARSVQALDPASGKQLWVAKCATTATSTPILAGNEVIVAAWNKMGEPSLRPPFPSFTQLIDKHDQDGDKTISRQELPTLWIFHRPEGAEAPMNGATVRFDQVDRDRNRRITKKEWSTSVSQLERFRARYQSHGLLALPLENKGPVGNRQIRTLETRGIPEVPSPVSDGKYVYLVKNGGVLTCLDLKTGKRVYKGRTGGRGTHYASPLIAGGHLFATAGDGRISVFTLGPKPKRLAMNEMGERVSATPAIADGVIYVRTHSTLFAFGKTKP